MKYFSHLEFGRFGGRGRRIGGLKSKCWCDVSTRFSVTLYAQHEPNINESTHIPTCWPSDLMHSQTNMHVPPYPFAVHGFGLIFNVLLMLGIEFTSLHSSSSRSDAANHLLRIVDQKCNLNIYMERWNIYTTPTTRTTRRIEYNRNVSVNYDEKYFWP